MKTSALSNCSEVFTYLKKKYATAGHMINTNAEGMPFNDPDDAKDFAFSTVEPHFRCEC